LEGKARIVEEMLPTISKVPNAVLKSGYIKSLADNLDIDEDAVRQELKKLRPSKPTEARQERQEPALPKKLRQSEKILAGLLIDDNNCISAVKESLSLEDFKDPAIRSIIELLYKYNNEGETAITPGKLISRLEDGQAHRLIPELVDCVDAVVDRQKTLADCVLKIKQDNLKDKLNRLQIEIALAQNKADEERITKLISECTILLRSVKAYEGNSAETQNEAVKA
ncbi:MAG: hypothetical protein PHO42_06630, partial [Candidatus Omnitrophica bacterium]|nr:hypothetical protein [Candidatus Omnitrophota bacterium]